MKYFNIIFSLLTLFILTSCVSQAQDNKQVIEVESLDLIGMWKSVREDQSAEKRSPEIDFFQILNDSIAEIQIIDSAGKRKIKGSWGYGFALKLGASDLKLMAISRFSEFVLRRKPKK